MNELRARNAQRTSNPEKNTQRGLTLSAFKFPKVRTIDACLQCHLVLSYAKTHPQVSRCSSERDGNGGLERSSTRRRCDTSRW